MTLGPNSPVGNGPVLINIEAQADYIVKMMAKFQKENLRSFRMRSDAVREFNEWKDEYMKETGEFLLFFCPFLLPNLQQTSDNLFLFICD